MMKMLRARIYSRSRHADWEDVKLKLYDPDGTPIDLTASDEPSDSDTPAGPPPVQQLYHPAQFGPIESADYISAPDTPDKVTITPDGPTLIRFCALLNLWNPPTSGNAQIMLNNSQLVSQDGFPIYVTSGWAIPKLFQLPSISNGPVNALAILPNVFQVPYRWFEYIITQPSDIEIKYAGGGTLVSERRLLYQSIPIASS